jgi:hypothetical protein
MVTLVLLPGMDGTGQLFAPFLTALGHGVDVKVVRYPTKEPLSYAELESVATVCNSSIAHGVRSPRRGITAGLAAQAKHARRAARGTALPAASSTHRSGARCWPIHA